MSEVVQDTEILYVNIVKIHCLVYSSNFIYYVNNSYRLRFLKCYVDRFVKIKFDDKFISNNHETLGIVGIRSKET